MQINKKQLREYNCVYSLRGGVKIKKTTSKNSNFLDYTPTRANDYRWETDAEGLVTIFVENKGIFNRIAQAVFGKPKVSQIHLEKLGSFIWPLIDGKKTVFEIGQIVGEHFGAEADPLYPRLTKYFVMLKNCGFVTF